MPRVAVILPVWNCEHLLGRAVASIQGQTFQDWELWVADDGSSDASADVADEIAAGDKRIHVLRLPHRGIVPTMNSAVEACDAPLLARMDADDLSLPARLEMQLAALESDPSIGALDCQVGLEASEATKEGMRGYVDWLNQHLSWDLLRCALLEESPLCHPAVLMRRQAWEEAGRYLDDATPEDYSLWLRMVAAGWLLGKLPSVQFLWSDLPGRLTRTDSRYSPDAMLRLKVTMLPRLYPQCGRGVSVWGTGPVGRALVAQLRRADIPVLAYVDVNLRRVGTNLDGVPVRSYQEWHSIPKPFLAALGRRPAKCELRDYLAATSLVEGEDFIFLA